MWALWVYWGFFFPSGLAEQLVEAMVDLLYLARAEDTPNTHQLGMLVMTPSVGTAAISGASLV